MVVYEAHPEFIPPDDPDTRIWRYMSLAGFLHMLTSETLRFTVAAAFDDRWEGMVPDGNRARWAPHLISMFEQMRTWTAVNCWCMGRDEATGMWAQFAPGVEAIAIHSTYRRLVSAFKDVEGTLTFGSSVMVGIVKYVDSTRFEIPDREGTLPNGYAPLLYKRDHHAHERELRAVLTPENELLLQAFRQKGMNGVQVPVDLATLIEGVRLAPRAPDWLHATIRRIVDGRFSFEFSALDDGPGGAKRVSSISDDGMVKLDKLVLFPPPE